MKLVAGDAALAAGIVAIGAAVGVSIVSLSRSRNAPVIGARVIPSGMMLGASGSL
jgi:hypothetical protein